MRTETQEFLKRFGIRHRVSRSYKPHSSQMEVGAQRAESVKIPIRETLDLLTCADSSTDTKTDRNKQKGGRKENM